MAAATKGSFQVSVGVVDSATKGLRKINAEIAALKKPYVDLAKQVQRFSDQTGITRVSKALVGLGSYAIDTAQHIAKVGLSVAGIAGIASIGGLVALTSKWGEWGNSIAKTSAWLGTTISQTIGMSQMSRLLGAAPDAMAQSYEHLSDMQRRARLGLDPVMLKNFRTLGVSLTDTEKGMQQIFDLGRKLRANKDDAGMRALFEMFGISADLVKEISTGTDTLAEFKRKAEESGKSLAPFAEDADKFRTAIASLGIQLEGVFAKALEPFVKTWTEWLSSGDNQKTLIQGVQDFMDVVVKMFEYVKVEGPKMWAEFAKGEGILHDLKTAFDFFTGQGVNSSGVQPSLYHAYDNTVSGALAIPDENGVIQPQQASILDKIDSFLHGLRMPHWPHLEPANNAEITKASQAIFDVEKAGGRNDWQALAMIANYRRESGLDPRSTSDAGGHLGLGQWDAERQGQFLQKYGHTMDSMMFKSEQLIKEQAEFGNYELTHGQSAYAQRFLASNDPSAVGKYTADIERSANVGSDIAKSNAYAQDTMSRLHMTIEHLNPPAGSSVQVATRGPLFPGGPPPVVTTMPFGTSSQW